MSIRFPELDIQLNNVPWTIRLGSYRITMFGLLVCIGLLLGLIVILVDAKRKGKNPNHYLGMWMFSMFGGLLGARAFYAAFHWELFEGNLMEILRIQDGGFAIYGAIFGGMLFGAIYCAIAKQSFWDIADTLSLGVLLAQVIGRWGDFFERCSFGEYIENPLSMQLPLASVRTGEVTDLMRENLMELGGVSYVQVTPVFFYESVACLILLLVLFAINRRKKYPGAVFMRYLAFYGAIRGAAEMLRTDPTYIPGTTVSINVVISLVLLVFFGLMARIRSIMTRKREEVRRQHREKIYQAEERAEAEMDAKEAAIERIGRERLENETKLVLPEDPEEEAAKKSASESKTEPEVETEPKVEPSEEPAAADSDRYQNAEFEFEELETIEEETPEELTSFDSESESDVRRAKDPFSEAAGMEFETYEDFAEEIFGDETPDEAPSPEK